MRRARRPWPRPVARLLALALVLVAAAAVLVAVPSSRHSAGREVAQPGPLVVVGVPSLAWGAVDARSAPGLWSLVERGAVGALVTRSYSDHSCSIDSWLTLSAGVAATTGHPGGTCPGAPSAQPDGTVARSWARWRADNLAARPPASIGSLADLLAASGQCVSSAGPAAALGAAGADGIVHGPTTSSSSASGPADPADIDLTACPVTMISLAQYDDTVVSALLPRLSPGTTLVVAGMGDDDGPTTLHTVVVAGPGVDHGTLTSDSTRQRGMVTTTDLSALVLARLGPQAPVLRIGRPPQVLPASTSTAVTVVRDLTEALDVEHPFVPTFFGLFLGGSVVLLLAGAMRWLLVARHESTARSPHRRLRGFFSLVGAMCACMPVATFLVGAVPWWRMTHPRAALCLGIVVASALVTLVAYAGPWRREPSGPMTVLVTVTFLVIALDVLRGSALQLVSVMGLQPVHGGRYYGMGNVAAAVWLTASLLMATMYADRLVRAGHRRAATWTVVLIGAVTLVVDSAPWWGAKAGAMFAIVPAFAFLTLRAAGRRPGPRGVFGILGLTVVTAGAFGLLDYLRPVSQRTHIGTTVADVLERGDLRGVTDIVRLNWIMLTSSWLDASVLVLVVAMIVVLVRPRLVQRPLADVLAAHPLLGPGLASVVLCWLLAFVSEDSGTGIPPTGLLLVAPLLTLLAAREIRRGTAPASS